MRGRRVLLIAGILLVAGGITAAGLSVLAYNELTKIDRSDPEVVTDEFLRAVLIRKDDIAAELYSCANSENLAAIRALRDEFDERERDFGVTIGVTWGAYVRAGNELTVELSISGVKDGNVTSRRQETWQFLLVEEDGWRVCSSEKIEDNPT